MEANPVPDGMPPVDEDPQARTSSGRPPRRAPEGEPRAAATPAFVAALLGVAVLGAVWLFRGTGKKFYAHSYLVTEVLLGMAAAAAVATAIAVLLAPRLAGRRPPTQAGTEGPPEGDPSADG